ncbi:hypothetical protein VDGE_30102 [Verticillium dahliae]|uniref:Uncharacterized protein n=1 Tax=Verticillium dahliae TaxID=27337 RepID=A0A444S4P9_VERDA|nr:hypothetical protein VDGE_30102 [Verticillium dahliae]
MFRPTKKLRDRGLLFSRPPRPRQTRVRGPISRGTVRLVESWAGHHAATPRPNMSTRAPAPASDACSYRQATKGLQEIVG